ncbi:hypothetical protein [Pantoea sp. BAV 3049]|uniref:hypothetical protein n=1 Tax=Pantoea sp. BAV 3049 TaxID=2654188 RepID=UPI001E4FAA18|nr:hypothetical protein [Pantoea sp. BAV 3049]
MNKSFLMRTALVFFLLAVACGVAGYASRTFWLTAFESLKYGITDFAALDAENQAMKTPLNLVMYVMPVGFGCAGVGLLAASALAYCLGVLDGVMTYFSCRSGRKDGQHA